MHIIKAKTRVEFASQHADADRPLRTWRAKTKPQHWRNMQDVLDTFPSARPISADRVVFNIKDNDYRLIVSITFADPPRGKGHVWIKFLGTHADYDKIDALTVDDF